MDVMEAIARGLKMDEILLLQTSRKKRISKYQEDTDIYRGSGACVYDWYAVQWHRDALKSGVGGAAPLSIYGTTTRPEQIEVEN